jgi:hypothetical protein
VQRSIAIADMGDILRGGLFAPWNLHKAAWNRPKHEVAVAFIPDEAGFGNVLAGDIESQGLDWKEPAVPPGRHKFIAAQIFAALHPAHVGP